MSLLQRTSKT